MLDEQIFYQKILKNEVFKNMSSKYTKYNHNLNDIYSYLNETQNIKSLTKSIYTYIKENNINKHTDLIPFIEKQFKQYDNFNPIDKNILKIIFKKDNENTYENFTKNKFKVRNKKLCKVLTKIFIDLIILNTLKTEE